MSAHYPSRLRLLRQAIQNAKLPRRSRLPISRTVAVRAWFKAHHLTAADLRQALEELEHT